MFNSNNERRTIQAPSRRCTRVWLLVALTGLAAAALGDTPASGKRASVSTFTPAGPHASQARQISFPDSPTLLLLWQDGQLNRFAISRDGRHIDQVATAGDSIRLRYATFDPRVRASLPVIPPQLASRESNELYLVQFAATPLHEMRVQIENLGGTVHRFLTDNTHIIQMAPAVRDQVEALPYVRWVGPYHPAYRLDAHALHHALGLEDQRANVRYGIELMERGLAAQQEVADFITMRGGIVEHIADLSFRMEATLTPTLLRELAHRNDVNFIDIWLPPGGTVNLGRQLGGAVPLLSTAGFLGQGVRGEVVDGGIQMNHPEWAAQQPLIHGSVNSAGVVHGTNVYGIVFSTGVNNAQSTGFLPLAEQGIFGHYRHLIAGSRVAYTLESVDPAGPYRAVFQTNSWGHLNATEYGTIAAALDDAVFQSGLLIIQSQGNHGTTSGAAEAWAKNVVSVGGLAHGRSLDPLDHQRAGASIGPAADGRFKPDLAHFYSLVYTTTPTSSYRSDFGGTSAAAPLTAGHFGLLMQMWHEGVFDGFGGASTVFDSRPQYTTAKALGIAGAYRYNWTSGTLPNSTLTRDVQGWGIADLKKIYQRRDRIFIVNGTDPLENSQYRTYFLEIDPNEPELLITMAFNDPPGNPAAAQARINDLDLRAYSPFGQKYIGNYSLRDDNWSLPAPAGTPADTVDTVENIFVKQPAAGTWRIEVIGSQIIEDTVPTQPGVQADFSLAAIGGTALGQPALWMSTSEPLPWIVPPHEPMEIAIEIEPWLEQLDPASPLMHYRTEPGAAFAQVPMVPDGPGRYKATLPGFPCGAHPEVYFSAAGDGGTTVRLPGAAPHTTYGWTIGIVRELTLLETSFDAAAGQAWPQGWSADGLWHISTGRCIPSGECNPPTPMIPPTDSWAYYGRVGACNYSTGQITSGILAAPPVDLPPRIPEGAITLRFCSAMVTQNPTLVDSAEVLVNGVPVKKMTESEPWQSHVLDLTAHAGETVTLEWSFDSGNAFNNTFRGWHVDNIVLTAHAVTCEPGDGCYANCTKSTLPPFLNIDDFICFINEFAQQTSYADCNGDGVHNIDDFICFIDEFAQGCP